MLPAKTILLSALFLATTITAQTSNKDFLKKPHVLPSAERAYHAIYHELDSKAVGGAMYGQLYVALIEDQFTFGGDMDEWPNTVFQKSDRGCKPFMAANIHHLCADAYFLVHQDMVKLQKTAFQKTDSKNDPDLGSVCNNPRSGFNLDDDPDKLVYRYGHRILMTYKAKTDTNKCIGTYDTRTDTFTCMLKKENPDRLVPLEVPNFLWKAEDGAFAKASGNVEVFCKQLHYPEQM